MRTISFSDTIVLVSNAENPCNHRASVARLVAATLLDGRTVGKVLRGDSRVRASTRAAVVAAARRLHIALPAAGGSEAA